MPKQKRPFVVEIEAKLTVQAFDEKSARKEGGEGVRKRSAARGRRRGGRSVDLRRRTAAGSVRNLRGVPGRSSRPGVLPIRLSTLDGGLRPSLSGRAGRIPTCAGQPAFGARGPVEEGVVRRRRRRTSGAFTADSKPRLRSASWGKTPAAPIGEASRALAMAAIPKKEFGC